MTQIRSLLLNKWISLCGGAWGSQVILVAKPHQEHINDSKHFVWRICVSYRGLNNVTKIYEYPISQCDMAVTIFEIGSFKMCIIIVNAKQSCHQISVRKCDIEKLAFFAPDNKKYSFTVMPFYYIEY